MVDLFSSYPRLVKLAALGLGLAFLALSSAGAQAVGLSEKDYRYLQTEFAFGKDGFTLTNISADDAARLHEVINDPAYNAHPKSRALNVGDTLFSVERRTCQAWQLAHAAAACPEVSDARLKPGWQVAERKCITCHLTGTDEAPSFFKLAKSGPVDEKRLADALRSGHTMSSIALSPQELRELVLYINSLR